jgi:hypothetical protein
MQKHSEEEQKVSTKLNFGHTEDLHEEIRKQCLYKRVVDHLQIL